MGDCNHESVEHIPELDEAELRFKLALKKKPQKARIIERLPCTVLVG